MAFHEPLLLPLTSLAAGVATGRWLGMQPLPATVATLLLIALAVFALRRVSSRSAFAAAMAAVFTTGMLVDALHRPPPPPHIDFEPGETLILSGCVVEPSALGLDREQFVLELAPGARARVNWYVKPGESPPRFSYGEQIELEARLRAPRNFGNPGAFDFVHHLARRHIYWLATASSTSRLERLPQRCGSRLLAAIYALREASVNRLDALFQSDSYALGMSRAVLIGDTARLERIWADDYRRSGTFHAVVISGIHLTILAACFLLLFRLFGLSGVSALAITAVLCWIYAIMTGAAPPAVRSAAGLTLFLGARFLYRRARLLNILAAVGILFLLADPDQLFDASFQLSFLAVALIGALAVPFLDATTEPFARGLRQLADPRRDPQPDPRVSEMRVELRLLAETIHLWTRLPQLYLLRLFQVAGFSLNYLWTLFVVSSLIQLGMLLPMVVYFHRFSISGVTANLLIVPAMNLLVPVGFLAIATGSQWLATLAGALLSFSRAIAAWHARWDPNWRVPDPPVWLAVLFLLSLLAIAVAHRLAAPRCRRAAIASFTLSFLLLVTHPFPHRVERGWLEFTALDVGQGDSLLIAAPDGHLMLFDTGGFPPLGSARRPSIDIGEDVVSPYLFSRSIKRLDVVAISHLHEDHMGGLIAILRNFRPRELWVGAFPDSPAWTDLRRIAENFGARIIPLRAGENRLWCGARIDVVSPPPDYQPKKQPANSDSLAFILRFGQSSILLTGDLEKDMESRMLAAGFVSPVDVLKVAHHGSRTSTTAPLLEAARPRWAVISAGAGNPFRHPHPDVLKRLARQQTIVWRTDLHGQVRFLTNGYRWRIEPFWPSSNGY
jgi:competence protein ComEC